MSIKINGVSIESTVNEMSNTQHGAYVLANEDTLVELQRSNNFEFVVTGLDGILRAGANGSETNAYLENAEKVLRLSVSSAFVPHFSQGKIEVRRGNSSIKYAGVPTFDSGSITLNDYIGADTKAVLAAWQNLSYNVRTEKVGLVTDYKKDCYLIEYTPDYQEVRRWKLHGCWISALSEDPYNHDNNDKHSITATIEYDRGEIDMKGNE